MITIKRLMLAAPVAAAMGVAALTPAAQAQDREAAIAAGALLGAGAAAIATGAIGAPLPVYDPPPPVVYEAPPRVVYERPRVIYE